MVTEVKNHEDLQREISLLKEEISFLKEQLDWYRRQVFGQKSEQLSDIPGENPDLPGLELPEEVIIEEPKKTNHVEYDRKARNKGTCTLVLPDNLPVEEIIKDIPEEEKFDSKTNEELVEIGREVVDKLSYKEASYYIKRFVYIKYSVRNNPLSGVRQTP